MLHGQDLLGDGVNVAARLQTAAEPGGICISGSVHDQIRNKLSLSFQSLGEMNFKNIQQPVRTFSITEAAGRGALPSPKSRGVWSHSTKWIAAGLLLLAGGGYWTYTVRERSKAEHTRVIATAAQPQVTRRKAPPPSEPKARTTEAPRLLNPHEDSQGSASDAAATSVMSSGRYDGVYSGLICYGENRNEPERCYHAEGTLSGSKIASQWTMGREKKVTMLLAGNVARSGDVKIEIEMRSEAVGPPVATIELTGTLRGGLINASGSFRKGRAATLNWHKNSGGSH
jgi:hypothetical protein